MGGDAYNDNLIQDSWAQTISFSSNTSFMNSFEGENYLSASRVDADWGGWGFKFADGATDMSSYYNGKLEVSIKLASPSLAAGNFEIGLETAIGQIWVTLSSLGFDQSSTDLQTISIPLNSAFNQYITQERPIVTANCLHYAS